MNLEVKNLFELYETELPKEVRLEEIRKFEMAKFKEKKGFYR